MLNLNSKPKLGPHQYGLDSVYGKVEEYRKTSKFINPEIPFTPHTLMGEVTGKLPLNKNDSIAVFFTVEWAAYLVADGYTDVTLITEELDDQARKLAVYIIGCKYDTYSNLKERFMKFSAGVGNPPFQNPNEDTGSNLWPLFVEKSLDILKPGGHLALITPCTWMRPTADIVRKGGNKYVFNDFMKGNNTKVINASNLKSHFQGVGSTFSYYVICNEPPTGTTKIICDDGEIDMDLNGLSVFPYNAGIKSLSIFKKVQSKELNFTFKNSSPKIEHDDATFKLVPDAVNQYMYVGGSYNAAKCNQTHDAMIYYHDKIHPAHNKPKIVINYVGAIKPYVDDGNCGAQRCIVQLLINTDEVEPAKSVVKSKLFKFIYQYMRWGMHNEATAVNMLTRPPFTKVWTDAELYAYYGLTQDEIAYVEANQP